MNTKRIMSHESNVYHREYCKHVKKIKKQNQIIMSWDEAKLNGYRPCRCCNNMNYQYVNSQEVLRHYEKEKGMEFLYRDGILYVKTEAGCWKLVYTRATERIALYHRNQRQRELDFQHPEKDRYHQQTDQLYFRNISSALQYIFDHDKFRAAEKRGDKNIKYKNKKYEQLAKKREKRQRLRNVDRIFKELERQNKDLVKCSMC